MRRNICPAFSNDSNAWTRPGAGKWAERGSVFPSSNTSSKPTAATSGWKASRERAARSISRCPKPSRHTECVGAAPIIRQLSPNCRPCGRVFHTGVCYLSICFLFLSKKFGPHPNPLPCTTRERGTPRPRRVGERPALRHLRGRVRGIGLFGCGSAALRNMRARRSDEVFPTVTFASRV